jgi:hypothetical protein
VRRLAGALDPSPRPDPDPVSRCPQAAARETELFHSELARELDAAELDRGI